MNKLNDVVAKKQAEVRQHANEILRLRTELIALYTVAPLLLEPGEQLPPKLELP